MFKNIHLKITAISLLSLSFGFQLFAKENVGKFQLKTSPSNLPSKSNPLFKMGAGCAPATAQRELAVNNVRTIILNGGDMWWNLSNARYEIPKVQSGQVSKNALFSGALWIGGITQGNLRLAAQTYRQNGNDFFPGPLQLDGSASISAERCKDFDRIWSITREEVAAQIARQATQVYSGFSKDFEEWPGTGGKGEAKFLAPYFDSDGDGFYVASQGDYPTFNENEPGLSTIPDQMMFVCYNDKGNIHSETQGLPLNLEFRLQAFAFTSNDEVNNMTFYKTTIVNRGNETIDSCVFGQWVDPDLGNYSDDYVECDVTKNLGICYNGDDNDEGILGYGLHPPSVGVNFFQGPLDENGKQIGLTKFVYYDNNQSLQGNPDNPAHFWNYLNGKWKDGQAITYGGNGRRGSDTASYMFPGDTDPRKRPRWNEVTAGNTPADRRFLQTAGSFRLLPGAVNKVTIGVVWARTSYGDQRESFKLLLEASDKAENLFINNFKILRGPEFANNNAVKAVELNREIVINILNPDLAENYASKFFTKIVFDSTVKFKSPFTGNDTTRVISATKDYEINYKFQGYQIYQLKTANTPSDFTDQDQVKLIAQCDISDKRALIINRVFDSELGENVKRVMVNGEDKGIRHSFRITKDVFSSQSDQTLVNYTNYHFLVVPYAIAESPDSISINTRYLSGARPIIITAIPRIPEFKLNSGFTSGPALTKIEGIGNGGNFLDLNKESIEKALVSPYFVKHPKYVEGRGPVGIKVVDPFKVPIADFRLFISDSSTNSRVTDSLAKKTSTWYLVNKNTNITYAGKKSLESGNEQIFEDLGLSVTVSQYSAPGSDTLDESNGYIDASITFADPTNRWLTGVPDEAIPLVPFNWIRSGTQGQNLNFANAETDDFFRSIENPLPNGSPFIKPADGFKRYSTILGGTWAPFALAARHVINGNVITAPSHGPGLAINPNSTQVGTDNPLSALQSVDIVLTSDKSKWSRCIVLEMGEFTSQNVGNVKKGNLRSSPSRDINGNEESGSTGMSWFPGYAINVETGERLNIIFGEDSSLPLENGKDMIWNPTSALFDRQANNNLPAFGGKHNIYVVANRELKVGNTVLFKGVKYDECATFKTMLTTNSPTEDPPALERRRFLSQLMWVSIPLVSPVGTGIYSMKDGIVPTETTIKLRVKRPYAAFVGNSDTPLVNKGQPVYDFNTASIAPETNNKKYTNEVLDKLNVSPNPYFAYSAYEDPGNTLDNRVRIINVPAKCKVSIYTQSGFLVRRINKDDDTRTFVEWDLKNDANVPIASGVYLIHIEIPGVGERIIKWFGAMRTADFDSF